MAFGMTLIDGPVPNREDLVWDSSDLTGDSIPFEERHDKPDVLWWSIHIEENATNEMYEEMLQWCKINAQYQCGMRYDKEWGENYIIAFFRHPDDAFNFKMSWI